MPNGDPNNDAQPTSQSDAIDELIKQIGVPPPRQFPNAQDVADWKRNQAFYATPMEAYSQAGQARQNIFPMANVPDWLESPTGEIKGASLQPIMPNQSQSMTQAYIAAQRSPIAALGFDPHRIATSPESQVSMDFAGGYNLPSDMAWYDPAYQTTPVHESIHRGLRMLREADMMPNLGVHSYPAAEELLVRRFMDRLFPEAEYGRGPTGDQQIRDARRLIPFSDLDQIDEAAQRLYAIKHPRGPRASGGRTGYSPSDPRMRMLAAPFSGKAIGPEYDPNHPVIQDLSFDAAIDPASTNADKWRRQAGGAVGTFGDRWQGINDPRMSDEIVKANQQQDNTPDPLPNESFGDYVKRAGQTGGDEVLQAVQKASGSANPFLSDVVKAGGTLAPAGDDEVMKAIQKAGPPQGAPSPPAQPAQKEETAMPWSEVPGQALSHAIPSAGEFVKNVAQPFIHPMETYENIRDLGHGILQKAGIVGGEEDKPKVDAVMQFFKNRYGSLDALKNTMGTDPVGFAADASVLLTGGGGLAARVPGAVGELGEAARYAGQIANPMQMVTAPISGVGKALATSTGFTTGVGGKAVAEAARSGFAGGEKAEAFQQNLRGTADLADTVDDARKAMTQIRENRMNDYLEKMTFVKQQPVQYLDWGKIDDALAESTKIKTFEGQPISEATSDVRQAIAQKVQLWKNLSQYNANFKTPEGMDALKQSIGDIRDKMTIPGTPARVVANGAYSAVRQTIIDAVPEYAKAMKGYEEASDTLHELERTLSLPLDQRATSVDTTLRKLQSVLRNNVNTSYGYRVTLAQYLIDNGAPHLMARLAGQALSAPWSRGIGKLGMEIGMGIAGLIGYGHAGGLGAAALAVGAVPLYSPRFIGETAYYAGRAASLGKLPMALSSQRYGYPLYQAGRISNAEQPAYQ